MCRRAFLLNMSFCRLSSVKTTVLLFTFSIKWRLSARCSSVFFFFFCVFPPVRALQRNQFSLCLYFSFCLSFCDAGCLFFLCTTAPQRCQSTAFENSVKCKGIAYRERATSSFRTILAAHLLAASTVETASKRQVLLRLVASSQLSRRRREKAFLVLFFSLPHIVNLDA